MKPRILVTAGGAAAEPLLRSLIPLDLDVWGAAQPGEEDRLAPLPPDRRLFLPQSRISFLREAMLKWSRMHHIDAVVPTGGPDTRAAMDASWVFGLRRVTLSLNSRTVLEDCLDSFPSLTDEPTLDSSPGPLVHALIGRNGTVSALTPDRASGFQISSEVARDIEQLVARLGLRHQATFALSAAVDARPTVTKVVPWLTQESAELLESSQALARVFAEDLLGRVVPPAPGDRSSPEGMRLAEVRRAA